MDGWVDGWMDELIGGFPEGLRGMRRGLMGILRLGRKGPEGIGSLGLRVWNGGSTRDGDFQGSFRVVGGCLGSLNGM